MVGICCFFCCFLFWVGYCWLLVCFVGSVVVLLFSVYFVWFFDLVLCFIAFGLVCICFVLYLCCFGVLGVFVIVWVADVGLVGIICVYFASCLLLFCLWVKLVFV